MTRAIHQYVKYGALSRSIELELCSSLSTARQCAELKEQLSELKLANGLIVSTDQDLPSQSSSSGFEREQTLKRAALSQLEG